MKQRHLYSLLDQSYTTIMVVYPNTVAMPAPPPTQSSIAAKRKPGDSVPAWGALPQASAPWAQDPHYEGKRYTYKVPRDTPVEVDDFVVVHSDKRGLHIARVVQVHPTPQIDVDASFDYKWIVQRIDRSAYQARLDAERVFADAMLDIERVRQREMMLNGFHENLPEGSEARKLFDTTIQSLGAPTVDHTTADKA